MRQLLQSLLRTQNTSRTITAKELRKKNLRRLLLESMEERRVLATVTAFNPTPSGFTAELSEQVNTSNLNLYDNQGGAFGAADVTLRGATVGNVKGSLVIQGNSLTFVASGGPLAADTYTVTLRSAANAFANSGNGQLLDGEFSGNYPSGNGSPGGDFSTTFTVSNANTVVVSIPDFVRGPQQAVNAPAQGSGTALPTGLPVRVSNADGITSMTMTLTYDPAALNITAVELGAGAPNGSQVQANLTTPGTINVAFFSLSPMSSGAADLLRLVATVPENAAYGSANVIKLTSVDINAGAKAATADQAVHVVAYPGDANGNRRYDAEDARLIARVGVGLDSGFATSDPTSNTVTATNRLFPLVDPTLIGDVTGTDGLSPLDASDVLRRVVGLSTPNIPALPSTQAPTAIALSSQTAARTSPIGTTVGTFTTTDSDPEDTHTYSLVTGTGDTDNSSFTIAGNALKTAVSLDSAKTSYSVRVKSTDSTGRSFERTFTIQVSSSSNTAPTGLTLTGSTVNENQASGATVGTLSSTDANVGDTHTYTLVSGTGDTDNSQFVITGNTLKTAAAFNFEAKSSYSIRVRTTDSAGGTFEQALTINVTNVNEAASDITLSHLQILDGAPSGTVVGSFTNNDPDAGNTYTYALASGSGDTDNSKFTISGNQLLTAFNADVDTKSSYSIRVSVTDNNGQSFTKNFTIQVTNTNTAPTGLTLTGNSVNENQASGATVGTLSSTDANAGDTHTYTLVSGTGDTDNSQFVITGNTLKTAAAFNFETKSSYSIRVRTTDAAGGTFEQALTVNVTNVNEAASDISLSDLEVVDGSLSGTVVGLFTNNDPDVGNTYTYALASGSGDTDNSKFTISGNQLLTAFNADFDTKSSYSIRVSVTDNNGQSFTKNFTIQVTNTNTAPTGLTLTGNTVDENQASGATVGTLSSTDANAGDTHTYTLVSGTGDTDNSQFVITGNTLKTAAAFNFETKSSYSIRVRTTDAAGGTFEQALTVNVTNVNEAASDISLSDLEVLDGSLSGTAVGSFTNNDPDAGNTYTYALASGSGDTDNSMFTISGNQLLTAFNADFDTKSSYSIRVSVTDNNGQSFTKNFTIQVTDTNAAPTAISLTGNSVNENSVSGTTVGTLSTTDSDANDTHTYSLVSGTGDDDNEHFVITGNTIKTNGALDFETKTDYTIRVRSSDGAGGSFEQAFTINVANVNEAASDITLSHLDVVEGSLSGTVVGSFTNNDPDVGNTYTYALASGTGDTDNSKFTITGNQLKTAFDADFDTQQSYSIRVSVTDNSGESFMKQFTVHVTDTNAAPTAVSLTGNSVNENQVSGTVVGTISTTDSDASDTHSYTLVSGSGDDDNEHFAIEGNSIKTVGALDFETKSSYTIRVRSTDTAGTWIEQAFTVSVSDVNEAPTSVNLSRSSIAMGQPIGTAVGSVNSEDPENDIVTYSLVSGEGDDDNASFDIENGVLVSNSVFDQAIQDMYSIRVRAQDAEGLSLEQTLTILIDDVNVAPSSIAISNASISRDSAMGTVLGTLSTTDGNDVDEHHYSLVSGTGDTHNSLFTVVGNQIRLAGELSEEQPDMLTIRVRSEDRYGLSVEQELQVNLMDVV